MPHRRGQNQQHQRILHLKLSPAGDFAVAHRYQWNPRLNNGNKNRCKATITATEEYRRYDDPEWGITNG